MPTRMIREGFLDSEKVNTLDFLAECFYHRLMLVADDYGRFKASNNWLRSKLFPLKEEDQINSREVGSALTDCVNAGLVSLYEVDGNQYGYINHFNQRLQRKRSAFPPPPGNDGESRETTEDYGEESQSAEIHRDSPQIMEDHRESPLEVEGEEKKKEDTPLPPQGERASSQELHLESEPQTTHGRDVYPNGFERFRQAYPARRRGRIKDALRYWRRDHLEPIADKIIAAVNDYKRYHKDWQKEDCKYAPDIGTWLNQQRWLDLSFVPESVRPADTAKAENVDWWKPVLRERYKEFPAKIAEWEKCQFWQLPPDVQAELTKHKQHSETAA